jgi:hypothetical protein
MSVKRSILIPAILALSAAGSIVASSAVTATAAQASTVQTVVAAPATHMHT